MIVKNVVINPYSRRLHIVVTSDFYKDLPEINKKFNSSFTEEDYVLGMTQTRGGHHLVIINVDKHRKCFKNFITQEAEIAGTIAHEADHVCNTLFESTGTKMDINNDEPHAYLLGWIVGEITKCYLTLKEKEDGKKL